jgi:16S rRNA processing protein RimM
MPEAAWVTLARIVRAHGRHGEAAAEILTDFPERLLALREISLAGENRPRRPARVLACRLSPSRGGQAIFRLDGVDSIEAAAALVGLEIQVPIAERLPLPAGHYYITDLVGCEVWEAGESLGRVRDVQTAGAGAAGTPVLAVETPAGELLIPLAEEICRRIDTGARRIEVVLPEGLRELNRKNSSKRGDIKK